jgi:hypothetical protein
MLRDGIPTFGVELLLKGQPAQTAGHPGWRQVPVGPESILWQKEALVNEAARTLPDKFTRFAEVDADLWFESASWVEDTLSMLDRHPCGQPFEVAAWTGPVGEVELERPSASAAGLGVSPWLGHPGFSWAFRRDFFEAVGGFYDLPILGGADLLWGRAVIGGPAPVAEVLRRVGLSVDEGYMDFFSRAQRAMEGHTVGTTPGRVWHEYHGTRQARGYSERAKILENFIPTLHVERAASGQLTWTDAAPEELRSRIAAYFETRKEDT